MTIAFIGLGSNIKLPKQQIKSAIKSIEGIALTQVLKVSSLYKSKPIGPQNQNDYINAVAKIDTDLMPLELLECMQDIENQQGRIRKEHWGPRTLDLDILMFGEEIIKDDKLTIPHAEIENRSFVLAPLAEIDPNCLIPEKGMARDLLAIIGQEDLEIIR
ncbi:MAG: 2-amino-4-hydroxy-6-hydroxymethyldihydropteridine diphosphokinase [Pseudomonadota bacterium]|jgi:2-amino-4-hydroxy-6-hydroxymethyldihydropteridine diphosphokinase|nr:2-amino-4-hydroxy-6-hydroxymethyldihydropteridine diphosphokinase [Pseudomonadota bacterium]|tara:strand:+ start:1128 stop:1607 length:480 start_codon:yes stop_codon:yes gene_type:complete